MSERQVLTDEDVKEPSIGSIVGGPRIMLSTWCVECREQTPATRIYHGDGLCEAHFAAKVGRI